MKKFLLYIILMNAILFCHAHAQTVFQRPGSPTSIINNHLIKPQTSNHILPGAYQISEYLPLISGKRVGIFANQTSVIGETHLVDTLKSLGIRITKIFAPEHGFRGTADAGANIKTYTDEQTVSRWYHSTEAK